MKKKNPFGEIINTIEYAMKNCKEPKRLET